MPIDPITGEIVKHLAKKAIDHLTATVECECCKRDVRKNSGEWAKRECCGSIVCMSCAQKNTAQAIQGGVPIRCPVCSTPSKSQPHL